MGAEVSVEEAYRKWADELTRYATVLAGSASAADIVADGFTSVLARGESAWSSVVDPRSYLYRVVMNAALMSARSGGRRIDREMRWVDMAFIGEQTGDERVRVAFAELSVQQRAVMFLTYWVDLTPVAVASWLQISEGSVRRQLARARATMRKVLT